MESKWSFGYSYEHHAGDLSAFQDGSHEIVLGARFSYR